MSDKQTARLENWRMVGPKDKRTLMGDAYDHPRFAPGTFVRTSLLVKMEGTTAETLNTIYTLGTPAEA